MVFEDSLPQNKWANFYQTWHQASIGEGYRTSPGWGNITLKSLGPIDRKFYGHGEKDGFVLYEYIIKQFSSFCKYTNISVMKKNVE